MPKQNEGQSVNNYYLKLQQVGKQLIQQARATCRSKTRARPTARAKVELQQELVRKCLYNRLELDRKCLIPQARARPKIS